MISKHQPISVVMSTNQKSSCLSVWWKRWQQLRSREQCVNHKDYSRASKISQRRRFHERRTGHCEDELQEGIQELEDVIFEKVLCEYWLV